MAMLKRQKKRVNIYALVCLVVLSVYALLLLYMIFFGLITSLKGRLEFSDNRLGFPITPTMENYLKVLQYYKVYSKKLDKNVYIDTMIVYSLLYAGGCAFMETLACMLVGYATAKFNYKFNGVLTAFVIIAMTLPIVGSLPSTLVIFRALNLYDNFLGVWFSKFYFISVYFMVFRATFKGISPAYSEAAKIDGAGNLKVFLSIMIPLVKGTFSTIFLLLFVVCWNDYGTPLLLLPSYPTLSLGLYYYRFRSSAKTQDTPSQIAGCMAAFIPILIIFILFRNKVMGKVSMGGLKE